MITTIKGITLRYKNNKPFLTKLLDTSSFDSNHLKVGSVITIKSGTKYRVIEILYIDLVNNDIELLVEELNECDKEKARVN